MKYDQIRFWKKSEYFSDLYGRDILKQYQKKLVSTLFIRIKKINGQF